MNDELSKRQAAIRLRVAGESIPDICRAVHRGESWFHKWWQRYLTLGPEGLYDLTRAHQRVVNRVPPHVERALISIRRRLAARTAPQSRYPLVGAPQIRAELEALGSTPLPSLRTIERIIARAGLSYPPLQLARSVPQSDYPGPKAHDPNQLHQMDLVGLRYLKGDSTSYYFFVLRDPFDLAVYLEFTDNRKMDTVLAFLGRAWQQFGLPYQVQFDNGSEFCGFGSSAYWFGVQFDWTPHWVSSLIGGVQMHPQEIAREVPSHEARRATEEGSIHGWKKPERCAARQTPAGV